LARANKVELWDRDVLVSKLLIAREESPPLADTSVSAPQALSAAVPLSIPGGTLAAKIEESAEEPVTVDARCVSCGVVVSTKVRDYCLARPNRFAGLIYCFNHQRRAEPKEVKS
jgi:hypothetical protein